MKRAMDEAASKLAEDSHKGINRWRHKSDRRQISQEIVGAMARRRGGDARESVLSDERTFARGRSLITRTDSRGTINPRKLRKSSN